MDDVTLLALGGAALLGLVAALSILRRDRQTATTAAAGPAESRYAVSTEGMKRCPGCGMGNLVTDATCSACGKRLPG
jgi:cytochrome c5